ncbi:MAG: hypothetical protein ACREP7_11605 [Lysobacter sp.]
MTPLQQSELQLLDGQMHYGDQRNQRQEAVARLLPSPDQQPGEQITQQCDSGSSGQLLQHGRANALRLAPRPIAKAQQAISSLVRGFMFIVLSNDDGTAGPFLVRPSRTPAAQAVRRTATAPSAATSAPARRLNRRGDVGCS